MTDVLTLGEALIAFRSLGRLSLAAPVSVSAAGAEMNVAIGLARLGHQVSWVGRVGEDPAGDLALRTLRAESVDTRFATRDGVAPTGVMLVDQPQALSPVVTYHRRDSAGSRLTFADVEPAWQTAPRVLHVTGITPALSDSAREAVSLAIRRARDVGAIVTLDVNYRAKLWSRTEARAALAPLALDADVVIASEDELDLVGDGDSEASQIAYLLDARPSEVVIKRGRRGATHYSPAGAISQPALPVVEVNSIGAGDAFTAGYISGMLDDLPAGQRLSRAAACGALAVTGQGDWEQAPTRADLARVGTASEAAR